MKAPFPFFGGKSRVAPLVWAAFGDIPNYVEPFAGSLAVYLNRPHPHKIATLNDKDGLIVNFWRALQRDPEAVARWAAWPVAESELHSRHIYIVEKMADLVARIEGDPDFYDARIAGYWVYGISAWIGSGWCSAQGPWRRDEEGRLVMIGEGPGIWRRIPDLKGSGKGVHRERPHQGGEGKGINRKRLHISGRGQYGKGILQKKYQGAPFLAEKTEALIRYFNELAALLAPARITCGDWSRVCGPSPTYLCAAPCGVFLDPPYSRDVRTDGLYREEDVCGISEKVREWCLENGSNPKLRIALCGYEGEGHEILEREGWRVVAWKAGSSYARRGSQNLKNRFKERIWFSPHCIGKQTLW